MKTIIGCSPTQNTKPSADYTCIPLFAAFTGNEVFLQISISNLTSVKDHSTSSTTDFIRA